jgi:hypothetical protein
MVSFFFCIRSTIFNFFFLAQSACLRLLRFGEGSWTHKTQASDYRHSFLPILSNTLLRSTTSTFPLIALDTSCLIVNPVPLPGVLIWNMVMIFESLPSHQPFNIIITAGHLYRMMIPSKTAMFALYILTTTPNMTMPRH